MTTTTEPATEATDAGTCPTCHRDWDGPGTGRRLPIVFPMGNSTPANPLGGGPVRVAVFDHWWRGSALVKEYPNIFTTDVRWGMRFLPGEETLIPGLNPDGSDMAPSLAGEAPVYGGPVPQVGAARGHRSALGKRRSGDE